MIDAKGDHALPRITHAQVLAVRPEAADQKRLEMSARAESTVGAMAIYIVKLYLQPGLQAVGQGAALYVGDAWIRRYWEFPGGIYFNAYDADFLTAHQGDKFRFTLDHENFADTGVRLQAAIPQLSVARVADLPTKMEALSIQATPGH